MHMRIEYMLRAAGSDWTLMTEADYDNLRNMSTIRVFDSGLFDKIDVPQLVDGTLYGEWLDRALRQANMKEIIPYKKYRTHNPINNQFFNLYKTDSQVDYEYVNKDGKGIIEKWEMDRNKKLKNTIYRKEQDGIVLDLYFDREIVLSSHILQEGDLYKHPNNIELHALNILLEPPENTYWGENLYYNPNWDHMILVKVGDGWVWTLLDGLLAKTPSYIEDEIGIVKQFFIKGKSYNPFEDDNVSW